MEPNEDYLTLAADGTVIGVQHAVGFIDHQQAQYCRGCTRDFDRDHLIKCHIPHYHAESNSYLTPPAASTVTTPSLRRRRDNNRTGTLSISSSSSSSSNSSSSNSSSKALEKSIVPYSHHPRPAVPHKIHELSRVNERRSPMPPAIQDYASNPWKVARPQPVSFPSTDSLSLVHGNPRSLNPTGMSSSDEFISNQLNWLTRLNPYTTRRVENSTEHAPIMSSFYDSSRSTLLPLIPEKRSVHIVSGEQISFRQDARPHIAAMIRARREASSTTMQHQRCEIRPAVHPQAPTQSIGTVGKRATATKSRQINLPTKKVKRSRKSRPSRIQVVAPIHTSEPLDLSDSSLGNILKAQALTADADKTKEIDLSESSVSVEHLKSFNKEVTSPGVMEAEFPPNIQRMSPIDTEKALDLSKRGSQKVTDICKVKANSNQSSLSPPCLEKIPDHKNVTPLDLSTTHYRKQLIHAYNATRDTSATHKNTSEITHTNSHDTVLPKIGRVFTLNPQAVNQSKSDKLLSYQMLENSFNCVATASTAPTITKNIAAMAKYHESRPTERRDHNSSMGTHPMQACSTVTTVASNLISKSVMELVKNESKLGLNTNSMDVSSSGNCMSNTQSVGYSVFNMSYHHKPDVRTTNITKSYEGNGNAVMTPAHVNNSNVHPNVNTTIGSQGIILDTNTNNTRDNMSIPNNVSDANMTTNIQTDVSTAPNSTAHNITSDVNTAPYISSDTDIISFANITHNISPISPDIPIDTDIPPDIPSDANVTADNMTSNNGGSTLDANLTGNTSNTTTEINDSSISNVLPTMPIVDVPQQKNQATISEVIVNSRPKRACKSLGNEAKCRRGCIGCKVETKRPTPKSPKKSVKRKLTTYESPDRNMLAVTKASGAPMSDTRYQTNQSNNEPMDLSKPSKKIIKRNPFQVKKTNKMHSKFKIKTKNTFAAKRKAIFSLPITTRSIIINGKAPVIRLQKLSQKDVIDLSGYVNQGTDNEGRREFTTQQPSVVTCSVTSAEYETQPLDRNNKCDDTGCGRDGVASTKLPNFQRDLLLLTSGFDD